MTIQATPHLTIYSPSWRGGAGRYVRELAVSVAGAGVAVTLVSPTLEPEPDDAGHFGVERVLTSRGHGGKGSVIRRALSALARVTSAFPILARQRAASPWYLVTMTDWLPVKLAQFLWIRAIGGKLIYVVHDATPHAWSFPRPLHGLERWLLRFSYHLPQRLVTLTAAARDELAEHYGVAPTRLSVIPHGAYESGTPRPMSGGNIVLAFGMLRRNKRILETIEAMKLLPPDTPLRLVIAGAPHADDLAYWQECEAGLASLSGRVRTEIGFVSDARVAELLVECDALILPYEGFNSASGVASLGAFAERLLICTDVGGMGELIESGLEPVQVQRPVTARSIADALANFLALPLETRRAMASRSRERLADHLSWQRIGKLYRALLDDTRSDEADD